MFLLIKNFLKLKTTTLPRNRGVFFRISLHIIALASVMLVWQSCAEPDGIGLDLIDDQAGFLTTDTISILAFTEPDDSYPSSLSFQNLLGLMRDPVFGKVRASVFTEIRLPSNNFSFGTNPVLDSIVLSFGYSGRFYGIQETMQTIRVYELTENMPASDTIYSNRSFTHNPQHIGERILRPAPADSTLIDTIFYAPHFTVRLSNAFGQKFLDANGTRSFENNANWLEYFKGLKITVEDNFNQGGAVFSLNMYSLFTRLSVHYKEASDTLQIPRATHFYITEFTRRSTFVEHFGFEGSIPILAQQLNNPNQANDSLVFVRALGGLRARIKLPHINRLAALPKVTINQAQLIIPVDSAFINKQFFAARGLILLRQPEPGKFSNLLDSQIGSTYFGGVYNEKLGQYEFNITQHVQEVLSGRIENNDLVLFISGSAENAERIVLRSPGRKENPMRMRIRYSVFN